MFSILYNIYTGIFYSRHEFINNSISHVSYRPECVMYLINTILYYILIYTCVLFKHSWWVVEIRGSLFFYH